VGDLAAIIPGSDDGAVTLSRALRPEADTSVSGDVAIQRTWLRLSTRLTFLVISHGAIMASDTAEARLSDHMLGPLVRGHRSAILLNMSNTPTGPNRVIKLEERESCGFPANRSTSAGSLHAIR
jgi:hypothetical protein